ncbi:MAG: hypothetical protein AAF772_06105 [Acidobacteriota bacterium]
MAISTKVPNLRESKNQVVFLAGLSLLCTGCESFDSMAADRAQMWLWIVIPSMAYLLAGGLVVYLLRRRQLKQWNLVNQSSDPGIKGIALGLTVTIFVIVGIFLVLNIQGQISDEQKYWNVGLWMIGSIIGGLAAFLAGLWKAEPKSITKSLQPPN